MGKRSPNLFLAVAGTLLISLSLSGCAQIPQEQPIAVTPSGHPEATFDGVAPAAVAAKIAAECMNSGMLVTDQTGAMVVCQKTETGAEAIAYRFVLGNAYSTTPVLTVRFSMIPVGNSTRAQGAASIATQMPLGQVQSMELNGAKDFNVIQAMFYKLGGHS